jgi:arylsulfatase A-like enzyme
MIAMVLGLHITEAAETSSQPNIVLILADDFGWGDASCNRPDSKIKTPAIDRIAEEGIRFTNAHSPSAVCAPTRYGLLTGRYPWRSYLKQRVLSGYCPSLIREGQTTIPSYLKTQGYHTAGYGKWHLGMDWTPYPGDPENWRSHWKSRDLKIVIQVGTGIDHSKPFALSPIDHGFDTFFGTPSNQGRLPFFIENNRVVGNPQPDENGLMRDPECARDTVDDIYIDKTLTFIEDHEKTRGKQPFFVYLALNAIHGTVIAPERFKEKSGLSYREDKILWLNESVGKLLTLLDRLELTDDTLVIFTADNGPVRIPEVLDQHLPAGPYRGFKTNVWDGGTRVPFLARWPGHIPAGALTDQLIGLTDVLATIAAVSGNPLPEGAGPDSINQLPALLQQKGEIKERPALVTASNWGFFAIRQDKWKAIYGTKWSGGIHTAHYGGEPPEGTDDFTVTRSPDDPGIGQLYDLSTDPYETKDLWENRPEVVAMLRKELQNIKQLDKGDEFPW